MSAVGVLSLYLLFVVKNPFFLSILSVPVFFSVTSACFLICCMLFCLYFDVLDFPELLLSSNMAAMALR
jgi:hypothetical protein